MDKKISPIAITVISAAAAAALTAAVTTLPLRPATRITVTNTAVLLCLAAYSAYLARSTGRSLLSLFAPLCMLCAVLAVAPSVTGFVVPAAAGLSWVRSGICFQDSMTRRLIAEAVACPAGLALVWLLQAPGFYGWALGTWMFGLIQALYFVIVDIEGTALPEKQVTDGIAHARRRADALLREQRLERAFEELGL